MKLRPPPEFTSAMSKRETILVLAYLPVHLVLLQIVFGLLIRRGTLPSATANLIYYVLGFVYMLVAAFAFLRRDFDPLADRPLYTFLEVISSYGWMFICNFIVGMLMLGLPEGSGNPNNQSILETAAGNPQFTQAAVVYLGPLVEEMLFRAGIFGTLRRKNRIAAYAVSSLLFALYHVLPYAVTNAFNWVYLLQYLPVSFLLARCYERTNSIWGSTMFHMLVNGIAFSTLNMLQNYL